MSVIELEIDRILKESLSEGYPMYAKDWEYYGSKSRGAPAASTPSSEPEEEGEPRPERKEDCERIYREEYEDYRRTGYSEAAARASALDDMEQDPKCRDYEPQGEPSEEEDEGDEEEVEVTDDGIDCEEFLRDPEVKKLLNNIEASQTVKRLLADTLRNLSLTIDISTISIATALGAVSTPTVAAALPGWATAAGIAKIGGFASAGSLIGAATLGFLNGDYKVAAIDGGAAVLSALLAGGGAASKGAKSVLPKILQRGAAKLAQLEAKIAAKLVAKGVSEQLAKTIAKGFITSAANKASGKLRQIIGDIPKQKEGESDQDYKQRLQRWQQEQSEKVAEIFNKCYKKTEDTQTTKNIKKAIKGFDKVVNVLARQLEKFIELGVGLIKGGSLNESQLRVAEELGLNDAQILNEEKLVTLRIDFAELRKQELNESFLAMFGGWVESILKSMFGKTKLQLAVTGSDREVRSFANAISGEKSYMDAVKRYGLDHPTTYKNKAKLDNSIKGFERETGLKWPFK